MLLRVCEPFDDSRSDNDSRNRCKQYERNVDQDKRPANERFAADKRGDYAEDDTHHRQQRDAQSKIENAERHHSNCDTSYDRKYFAHP
jgi:hypothetical protein